MSKNIVTLKSGLEVTQGQCGTCLWSLLVFYSTFVPKLRRFWDSTCNYTVTLKPGLGVTHGHRNRHLSIRHLWFLINIR